MLQKYQQKILLCHDMRKGIPLQLRLNCQIIYMKNRWGRANGHVRQGHKNSYHSLDKIDNIERLQSNNGSKKSIKSK